MRTLYQCCDHQPSLRGNKIIGCPADLCTPVSEGVRLQYTGHAGFLIENADTAILIDPVIASTKEGDDSDNNTLGFAELLKKIWTPINFFIQQSLGDPIYFC